MCRIVASAFILESVPLCARFNIGISIVDPAISQIIQESDLKDNLDGSDENKDSIPLKDRDFNHIISGIFSSLFSKVNIFPLLHSSLSSPLLTFVRTLFPMNCVFFLVVSHSTF